VLLARTGVSCSPAYIQGFPRTNGDTLIILLKCFDASKQSLHGIGKMYIQRNMKVGDLTGLINGRLRWPRNTRLKLFEEIMPGAIEPMNTKANFAWSKNGDIICFQVDIPERQ
jgi:ubiquitin carboxyl-terminal hydrolase 7